MFIYSVADGVAKNLDTIPDELFSKRVMGDGIAVHTREEWLFSPMDAEVTIVFETKHAVGLKGKDGTELLIHIGVDTVNMQGEPFVSYVEVGENVKAGDLLMHVDFHKIEESGYCSDVMMIATNKKVKVLKDQGEIKKGDPLIEVLAAKEG